MLVFKRKRGEYFNAITTIRMEDLRRLRSHSVHINQIVLAFLTKSANLSGWQHIHR